MTDMPNLSAQSSPPAEIAKAILSVMEKVTGVGKTGRNEFHRYDYSTKEDVLKVLQPAMVEAGLACVPHITNWRNDDYGNFVVHFDMELMHKSGETHTVPWIGVAQDKDKQGRNGDKWANKAATAAEKYFLLKLFHIPVSEEDADADANNASAGTQEGNAPTKAAKATPPPKAAPKGGKGSSADYVSQVLSRIQNCGSRDAVQDILNQEAKAIAALKERFPDDHAELEKMVSQYNERLVA